MRRFELSYLELDLIGELNGLDVRVLPFEFAPCGRTWDERLTLAGQADVSLAKRGLAGDGWISRDVTGAVKLLATGSPSITVQGEGPLGRLEGRAVLDGRRAVFVIRQFQADMLEFTIGRAEEVVGWLTDLLPRHHPAPGHTHTVRVDRTGPGERDDDFSHNTYLTGGVGTSFRERDERAVAAMFQNDEWGSGSFAVRTHGRRGVRMTVDWFDAEPGRWASYSTFGADGAEWRVYVPGTTALIGNKLRELIDDCAESVPR